MLKPVPRLAPHLHQTPRPQQHIHVPSRRRHIPEFHDHIRAHAERVDWLLECRVGVGVRGNALARLVNVHCDLVGPKFRFFTHFCGFFHDSVDQRLQNGRNWLGRFLGVVLRVVEFVPKVENAALLETR